MENKNNRDMLILLVLLLALILIGILLPSDYVTRCDI